MRGKLGQQSPGLTRKVLTFFTPIMLTPVVVGGGGGHLNSGSP